MRTTFSDGLETPTATATKIFHAALRRANRRQPAALGADPPCELGEEDGKVALVIHLDGADGLYVMWGANADRGNHVGPFWW